MNLKQLTATAAVCALAAGGTGAAVAATSDSGTGSGSGSAKSAKCAKPGKRGGPFKDLAAALGIKESELHKQLKAGKKLSEIAKTQGKTLDEVKTAVKASLKTKLDKAVADGKLTQAQADDQLSRVDTMIDNIEAGKKPPRPGKGGPGGPPGGPGGPPPIM